MKNYIIKTASVTVLLLLSVCVSAQNDEKVTDYFFKQGQDNSYIQYDNERGAIGSGQYDMSFSDMLMVVYRPISMSIGYESYAGMDRRTGNFMETTWYPLIFDDKTIQSNGLQTIVYSISNKRIISIEKITLLTLPTPGHISKWEETAWGEKWSCKASYVWVKEGVGKFYKAVKVEKQNQSSRFFDETEYSYWVKDYGMVYWKRVRDFHDNRDDYVKRRELIGFSFEKEYSDWEYKQEIYNKFKEKVKRYPMPLSIENEAFDTVLTKMFNRFAADEMMATGTGPIKYNILFTRWENETYIVVKSHKDNVGEKIEKEIKSIPGYDGLVYHEETDNVSGLSATYDIEYSHEFKRTNYKVTDLTITLKKDKTKLKGKEATAFEPYSTKIKTALESNIENPQGKHTVILYTFSLEGTDYCYMSVVYEAGRTEPFFVYDKSIGE